MCEFIDSLQVNLDDSRTQVEDNLEKRVQLDALSVVFKLLHVLQELEVLLLGAGTQQHEEAGLEQLRSIGGECLLDALLGLEQLFDLLDLRLVEFKDAFHV